MRFISLTVSIDGKIPSFKEGVMREIGEWFIKNGYYYDKILDITTKPEGIYFFRTNAIEIKLTKEECERFLERYKSRGLEYKLVPIDDIFESGFVSK